MIKNKEAISVKETYMLSILFYLLTIAILIYNFCDTYIEFKPIILQSEQIRNLTSFEVIDTSKLKFGLSTNNVRIDQTGVNLEFLKVKDERIFGMPLINMNTNTYTKFIPKFSLSQNVNSKPTLNCPYLETIESILGKNSICPEYFDKNITLGGSFFSGGETHQQIMELKIDFCDFYDIMSNSFNPSIIKNYIDSDSAYKDYLEFVKKGILTNLPSNFPFSQVMYTNNNTNLNKFYPGFKTNFQLENKEYLKCTQENNRYNRIVVGVMTSTDILKPDNEVGYFEFIQTRKYEFNPYKNALVVNIKLTKVKLITNRSLFIGLGKKDEVIIYEQEIEFLERPKLAEDNYYTVSMEYILEDRIKIVERSYRKVDEVLAASFSVINLILLFLRFTANFLTNKQVEYEIINKLYFTETNNLKENFISLKNENISHSHNNLKDNINYNNAKDNITKKIIHENWLNNSNNIDKEINKESVNNNNNDINSNTNIKNENNGKKLHINNENKENLNSEIDKKQIGANEADRNNKDIVKIQSNINLNKLPSEIGFEDNSFNKVLFHYKSGIIDILTCFSCDDESIRNNKLKNYLVNKTIKELDIIDIVARKNQLSKLLEALALEKYKKKIIENPNINYNDYLESLYDNMKKIKISEELCKEYL